MVLSDNKLDFAPKARISWSLRQRTSSVAYTIVLSRHLLKKFTAPMSCPYLLYKCQNSGTVQHS